MKESGLIVRFPDQSESYTNGFEAGIIWNKLESGIDTFEMNIHQENVQVIKDMCDHFQYAHAIQTYPKFEGWAFLVTFKKKSTDN